MGIVNHQLVLPKPMRASISLPLMGIVNVSVTTPVIVSTPSASLPLMGIVNVVAEVGLYGVGRLITPHGDRKRDRLTGHSDRQRLSLPLMGIVNPHNRLTDKVPGRSSLPLMGIVNGQRVVVVVAGGRHSLPLMGIVNPAPGTAAAPAPASASLPLMGIVNAVGVGGAPAVGGLITPHGDRKQQQPTTGAHRLIDSLPLMGIVNLRMRRSPLSRSSAALITPHGDRKPLFPAP